MANESPPPFSMVDITDDLYISSSDVRLLTEGFQESDIGTGSLSHYNNDHDIHTTNLSDTIASHTDALNILTSSVIVDLDHVSTSASDPNDINFTQPQSFTSARVAKPASDFGPTKMEVIDYDDPDTWRPVVEPKQGHEGLTPFLDENEFESADAIANPQNNQLNGNVFFSSLQEALSWRSSQHSEAPTHVDETVPRSLLQKKALVRILFKAFKSIGSATDNDGMLKPFREERHDNLRVECLCWHLLEALVRRSDYGPLLLAYDPAKARESSVITTFAQRFDEVVLSMREQKTICKHLLDAPYINTFVDDPVRARQRVESNRNLNKRKGLIMDEGKKQFEPDTPSPIKRSRKKLRPRTKARSTDSNLFDGDDMDASYTPATPTTPRGIPRSRHQYSASSNNTGVSSSDASEITPSPTRSAYRTPGSHSSSYGMPRMLNSSEYSPTPSPMSRSSSGRAGYGQLSDSHTGGYPSPTGISLPASAMTTPSNDNQRSMFNPMNGYANSIMGVGGQVQQSSPQWTDLVNTDGSQR